MVSRWSYSTWLLHTANFIHDREKNYLIFNILQILRTRLESYCSPNVGVCPVNISWMRFSSLLHLQSVHPLTRLKWETLFRQRSTRANYSALAHLMSTNSIPPRESLYSHTIISTQSKTLLQSTHLHFLSHTSAEPVMGLRSVIGKRSWDILHCG